MGELGTYLDSVRRSRPARLSHEEEYALFCRARSGLSPDPGSTTRAAAARATLIEVNIPLVVWVAKQMRRRCRTPRPLIELVELGQPYLIRAVDRFDPDRLVQGCRVRFGTFAAIAIRRGIEGEAFESRSIVRVPRYFLYGNHPRGWSPSRELVTSCRRAHGIRQWDEAAVGPLARHVVDRRHGDDADPCPLLRAAIEEGLSRIDSRQAEVVRRHLLADRPETLEKIGLRIGLSRERVRQIQEDAIQSLRVHFAIHPSPVLADWLTP